jgi:hypothetical protein
VNVLAQLWCRIRYGHEGPRVDFGMGNDGITIYYIRRCRHCGYEWQERETPVKP